MKFIEQDGWKSVGERVGHFRVQTRDGDDRVRIAIGASDENYASQSYYYFHRSRVAELAEALLKAGVLHEGTDD